MEELIDVLRAISSDLAEMKQLLKSAGLTDKDRATLNAMQDKLLTGVEAARMLGCSPQTIGHMRRDGRIKAALLKGEKLTPMDALRRFGCFRLGVRIWELRNEQGMDIRRSSSAQRAARLWPRIH